MEPQTHEELESMVGHTTLNIIVKKETGEQAQATMMAFGDDGVTVSSSFGDVLFTHEGDTLVNSDYELKN